MTTTAAPAVRLLGGYACPGERVEVVRFTAPGVSEVVIFGRLHGTDGDSVLVRADADGEVPFGTVTAHHRLRVRPA